MWSFIRLSTDGVHFENKSFLVLTVLGRYLFKHGQEVSKVVCKNRPLYFQDLPNTPLCLLKAHDGRTIVRFRHLWCLESWNQEMAGEPRTGDTCRCLVRAGNDSGVRQDICSNQSIELLHRGYRRVPIDRRIVSPHCYKTILSLWSSCEKP